jgi:hypothetical protein
MRCGNFPSGKIWQELFHVLGHLGLQHRVECRLDEQRRNRDDLLVYKPADGQRFVPFRRLLCHSRKILLPVCLSLTVPVY